MILMERIRIRKYFWRLHEKNTGCYDLSVTCLLVRQGGKSPSDKDKAVACIKQWEGWHRGKCRPSVTDTACFPHETETENLSEGTGRLTFEMRLYERCLKVFRKYGKDSLASFKSVVEHIM
ncbi:hypothetical protein NXW50_10545 [Bacteroides thetaiotaomicron]|nr:hypothetical protein [Bacteroides thetaiotaomicron]